VAIAPGLATPMNLVTEPEWKPKVIGWRMVHRRFDWSIFGRIPPSRKSPDKASIQG
jgi:hypothetical protein